MWARVWVWDSLRMYVPNVPIQSTVCFWFSDDREVFMCAQIPPTAKCRPGEELLYSIVSVQVLAEMQRSILCSAKTHAQGAHAFSG